jgi:putative ABC transport system permease protein
MPGGPAAYSATSNAIARLFLRQGLLVAVLGSMAGLALAVALRRMLAGLLFGVSVTDLTTRAVVVAALLAVSVLASRVPAIRASRLEPSDALREE